MAGLDKVFDQLEEIRSVSARTEKERLLKEYYKDEFKDVVDLALDYNIHFGINDVGTFFEQDVHYSADELLDFLYKFAEKRGVTNRDKVELIRKFSGSRKTWEVLKRIVNKDLRCGVSVKTVNKVSPGAILSIPYQRCSTVSKIDNVEFPAIVQEKADGMFCYASNVFEYPISRMGKSIPIEGKCKKDIKTLCSIIRKEIEWEPVLMGELVIYNKFDTGVLPRKTSNGHLNSLIKDGSISTDLMNRILLVVWDFVPYDDFVDGYCPLVYEERWNILTKAVKKETWSNLSLIPYSIVDRKSDAFRFYKLMRTNGKEGAVIKDWSIEWKDHTSPKIVKLKNVSTAEFAICGVEEGKGRLKGKMGSLIIKTEDEGIVCNVGTGFSDDERDLRYWKSHIGGIISVNFESVTTDKRTGKKKLFLPVFHETRFNEKYVADSTKYVEELGCL